MRVLIVEDDPDIRELLQLLLSGEGHACGAVPSGDAALARLRDEIPDLILLDLLLPGLDRRGFLQVYRARFPDARAAIVLMTAAPDRLCGVQAGAIISKPFEVDALLATIECAVRRAGARPGPAAADSTARRTTGPKMGEPRPVGVAPLGWAEAHPASAQARS